MSEAPPFSPTIALLAVSAVWEAALVEAFKTVGLTPRKFGLLGHIRSDPGVSFSELARRSRITVQSAHAATAALVEAGLVEDGTAHAGAASTLQVSGAGLALLREASQVLRDVDESFELQHPSLTKDLRRHVDAMLRRHGRPE